jgi:hypothetical protein
LSTTLGLIAVNTRRERAALRLVTRHESGFSGRGVENRRIPRRETGLFGP